MTLQLLYTQSNAAAAETAANMSTCHNATHVSGCIWVNCTLPYLVALGVHDLIILKELPPDVKEVRLHLTGTQ